MRHAYTIEPRDVRILTGHFENLECDRLALIPTPPNFDRIRDALGTVSIPHDPLKFIWCWDCTVLTTQSYKFVGITPQARAPTRELLGHKDDQGWKER